MCSKRVSKTLKNPDQASVDIVLQGCRKQIKYSVSKRFEIPVNQYSMDLVLQSCKTVRLITDNVFMIKIDSFWTRDMVFLTLPTNCQVSQRSLGATEYR